jgi:flavin-dependent dehydrogenase
LFAAKTMARASLPRPSNKCQEFGRALAREHLDTWLVNQAKAEGVSIYQPRTVAELIAEAGVHHCVVKKIGEEGSKTLSAPIVAAAHGSWDSGRLPTQLARLAPGPGDLLAFKAHFRNSDLPAGLMPLLAFPGGYGGMVHCDDGRVSLSCCVRRDQLTHIRGGDSCAAGDAVLAHIEESCLGVRKALTGAVREGAWLSAGPIRPGIRLQNLSGIFLVGNAAGESHPIIAEGISMAMQSAWLLCRELISWRQQSSRREDLAQVGRNYASAWRRAFAPRLHASQLLAEWAMRPSLVAAALPLIWCFPTLMTGIARLTGKATPVVRR